MNGKIMNENRIDLDNRIGLPDGINLDKDRMKLHEIPSPNVTARDLYNKYELILKDSVQAKIVTMNVVSDIIGSYAVVKKNVYIAGKIVDVDFNDGFFDFWNSVYDIIQERY